MKAAVWYGRNDVRIGDVPDPQRLSAHDVVIKVIYCGICGTDIHEYLDGPIFIPTSPHPLTGQSAPIILGHEAVGKVIEVGPEVSRVSIGDRVVLHPVLSCQQCEWCLQGKHNQCEKIGFIGLALNGAFAEFTKVPEYNCYKVPESVTDEEAALVEPVAMTVRAVQRAGVRPGQSALVIGTGPIGLAVIQAARAFGADPIIALEPVSYRREFAKIMGADITLDPYASEMLSQLRYATKGVMTDYVFECVGSPASLELSFKLVAKDGILMLLGVLDKAVSFNPIDIVNREYTIMGNMGGGSAFDLTMRLMETRRMNLAPLVTGMFALERLPEALNANISKTEKHIKVLISL